jgi:methylenetetrahydrofolate reductase (NADPH)
LFFDNQHYFSFVEKCHAAGINIPIVPGIMPITSYKQIKKMTSICGAKIPPKLLARLDINQQDPEAIREIGFEQAVLQCQELKAQHVPGLHFFVMNQSGPIKRILKEIKFSHPQ